MLPDFVTFRLKELPKGLFDHITRTRIFAREIANVHGVDESTADLAAACHDLARDLSPVDLLTEAERLSIPIDQVERNTPILLHGPIAATWLQTDGEIKEPSVIEAVRWHTTGHANMDDVQKVLFVADKAEPLKVSSNPSLAEVRDLAGVNLDWAILSFVDIQISNLSNEGQFIHPRTLELRNHLMMTGNQL